MQKGSIILLWSFFLYSGFQPASYSAGKMCIHILELFYWLFLQKNKLIIVT